jgi:hypothetical protein
MGNRNNNQGLSHYDEERLNDAAELYAERYGYTMSANPTDSELDGLLQHIGIENAEEYLTEQGVTYTSEIHRINIFEALRINVIDDKEITAELREDIVELLSTPASSDPDEKENIEETSAIDGVTTYGPTSEWPDQDNLTEVGQRWLEERDAMVISNNDNPLNFTQTRIVQGALRVLGEDITMIDGIAGAETRTALESYSRKMELRDGLEPGTINLELTESTLLALQDEIIGNKQVKDQIREIYNQPTQGLNDTFMTQAVLCIVEENNGHDLFTRIDGDYESHTMQNVKQYLEETKPELAPAFEEVAEPEPIQTPEPEPAAVVAEPTPEPENDLQDRLDDIEAKQKALLEKLYENINKVDPTSPTYIPNDPESMREALTRIADDIKEKPHDLNVIESGFKQVQNGYLVNAIDAKDVKLHLMQNYSDPKHHEDYLRTQDDEFAVNNFLYNVADYRNFEIERQEILAEMNPEPEASVNNAASTQNQRHIIDLHDFNVREMIKFVWITNGMPEISDDVREKFENLNIYNNDHIDGFSLDNEYYPTPEDIADFYIDKYIKTYPGDIGELRESIVAYEGMETISKESMMSMLKVHIREPQGVDKEDFHAQLEENLDQYFTIDENGNIPLNKETIIGYNELEKVSYMNLQADYLEKSGVIERTAIKGENGQIQSWESKFAGQNDRQIAKSEEKFNDMFEGRQLPPRVVEQHLRNMAFAEQHPDLKHPNELTSGMHDINIREYSIDRRLVIVGAQTDNLLKDNFSNEPKQSVDLDTKSEVKMQTIGSQIVTAESQIQEIISGTQQNFPDKGEVADSLLKARNYELANHNLAELNDDGSIGKFNIGDDPENISIYIEKTKELLTQFKQAIETGHVFDTDAKIHVASLTDISNSPLGKTLAEIENHTKPTTVATEDQNIVPSEQKPTEANTLGM